MALGFLVRMIYYHHLSHGYLVTFVDDQAHGYATNEFEVTPDRLGVYLPVRTNLFLVLPDV